MRLEEAARVLAPDDVPAHPYKVTMEVASLAQKAEVTIHPWKDSQEHIDEVVELPQRSVPGTSLRSAASKSGVMGKFAAFTLM